MIAIFKSNKKISRELFEKIICFEKFRKIYADAQPFVDASKINSESIAAITKMTRSRLNDFQKNKAQIKISQQATSTDDERMEIAYS